MGNAAPWCARRTLPLPVGMATTTAAIPPSFIACRSGDPGGAGVEDAREGSHEGRARLGDGLGVTSVVAP